MKKNNTKSESKTDDNLEFQANEEISGIESTNPLIIMSVPILIVCVFLLFVLILLMLAIRKKYRKKIMDKYKAYKKKMLWNGLIRTASIGYLNLCITAFANLMVIRKGK